MRTEDETGKDKRKQIQIKICQVDDIGAFGYIDGKQTLTKLTCCCNLPHKRYFVMFSCIRGGIDNKLLAVEVLTAAMYGDANRPDDTF